MAEDQNLPEEGEAVAAEVPEWVPEKFRTNPEKFGEAYTNLEREYHATRQQVKAMEDNYSTLAAQFEELQSQPSTPQYNPSDLQAQLYERYENDPIGTMALLANQAKETAKAEALAEFQKNYQPQLQNTAQANQAIAARYAWDSLANQNPDIANYRDQIGQFIQENPHYLPEAHWSDPNAIATDLGNVYKIVSQDDRLTAAAKQAEEKAAAEAMKLQAQSLSGSTGRLAQPAQDETEWAKIMGAAKTTPYYGG